MQLIFNCQRKVDAGLVCGLHFTKIRNLSDSKRSRPVVFEIETWAHRNERTVFLLDLKLLQAGRILHVRP